MTTVSHEVLQALVKLFNERFDSNELEDLAFALGVSFDDLKGNTRSAKARELAQFLNRRSMMDKLQEVGPQKRPELDWDAVFGGPPSTVLKPPPGITGAELAAVAQVVAALPDFAAQVDRRNMLFTAGVSHLAGGVDLTGPERTVSLRVLNQLNSVSSSADGHTPLGDFLRYVVSLPEALPNKKMIEDIIAKYRL